MIFSNYGISNIVFGLLFKSNKGGIKILKLHLKIAISVMPTTFVFLNLLTNTRIHNFVILTFKTMSNM